MNLVGVNSIEGSCQDASSFFDLMQSLYSFCASSTHRWNTFFNNAEIRVETTLKSLSSTRWSFRADASKVMCENYVQIRNILKNMSNDPGEKPDTRNEAAALYLKLGTLNTSFMAQFWDCILRRFSKTSESLQKADMDLSTAVSLLESLRSWVFSLRDKFDQFETSAKSVPDICQSYRDELQRTKKRKIFLDESTEHEVTLKGRERYKVETFCVTIDKLVSCLDHRLAAYRNITDHFGVLLNMECEDSIAREQADALCTLYPSDLDKNFADEIIQFRSFVQKEKDKSPKKMLQLLLKHSVHSTFPNTFVALRIFLTLPVTNCEGERSFSQMQRIKNELRTTQKQERLSALSLMAIESELVRNLDFEEVVAEFASRKARKMSF